MNQICESPLSVLRAVTFSDALTERCERLLMSTTTPTEFHLKNYLFAFGMTCLLELPFYFYLLKKLPLKDRIKILVLANLATHPLIYFVFPWVLSSYNIVYFYYLVFAETFAPLVEALLVIFVWKHKPAQTVLWITLANLTSWGLGAWLNHL